MIIITSYIIHHASYIYHSTYDCNFTYILHHISYFVSIMTWSLLHYPLGTRVLALSHGMELMRSKVMELIMKIPKKGEIDLDNSDTDCDDYSDCDEDNKLLYFASTIHWLRCKSLSIDYLAFHRFIMSIDYLTFHRFIISIDSSMVMWRRSSFSMASRCCSSSSMDMWRCCSSSTAMWRCCSSSMAMWRCSSYMTLLFLFRGFKTLLFLFHC